MKKEVEKEAIVRALERGRGCRQEAARQLRISLRALQYKIREYGIDSDSRSYAKTG
ncbi:MAG: helix-turn-helix domain-containing protein [Terriglobia bacterium]